MEKVCDHNRCTGCGMCSNICSQKAIKMSVGENDFIFPEIYGELCIDCGRCIKCCPSNVERNSQENVKEVYAAWSKNKKNRKQSSSGGIFSEIAKKIIEKGGVVAGVIWDKDFHPKHIIIEREEEIHLFRGSKYSQSNTSEIYKQIKNILDTDKDVLFSGTPCQCAALKRYLGKEYDRLVLIDFICHGVPSNAMLDRYYKGFDDKINRISLRTKLPFWDYSFVTIQFDNGSQYKRLTIEDPYFNLFNIGYSLRESCHNCLYTSTHRQSDITLGDFWGYSAHSVKTRDYNKGTSVVLINTNKGKEIFESLKKNIFYESSNIEKAINGNKSLRESYKVDKTKGQAFWDDYNAGMSVNDLNDKYCGIVFSLPNLLWLRRKYYKWKWIMRR